MLSRRLRRTGTAAVILCVAIGAALAAKIAAERPTTQPGRAASGGEISSSRVEARSFFSPTLGREMPYYVFLPEGYDSDPGRRYPVVYMLHGLSGTNEEWRQYGIFETADRLIKSGQIGQMIIVLPQGDDSYWMDHADGGPRWGVYVARDVTEEIDTRFRTRADPRHRGIGGLSMGADGALQLALNFPETFAVVVAESPVLRRHEDAYPFFGDDAWFGDHDPVTLAERRTEIARRLVISLEVGSMDLWLANVLAFHEELLGLGVAHRWRVSPGEHDAAFWTEHVGDDLSFFDAAFRQAAN